ncbi:MAG: TrmB family transcriptional regulator sugar-binding domain-containing protein, partial [Halalkalicoccus sp.]
TAFSIEHFTGLWESGIPVYEADELRLPITVSEIRESVQLIEPLLTSDVEIRVRIEGSWTRTGRSCGISGTVQSVEYGREPAADGSASVFQLANQAAIVIETDDDIYSVGGHGAALEDVTASRITVESIRDPSRAP